MTDTPATSAIPKAGLAIITGSANWGLAFPEDVGVDGVRVLARDLAFETPYGISENWKLLEFDASITAEGRSKVALCMYSHGNPRDQIDHSCHQRSFWVLMNAGVKRVLACSTIGAVNKAIQPGDMVINADIIELTQTPYSLLPGRQRFDCSGKRIVCPHCAETLASTARRQWPSSCRVHGIEQGLVAGHVYGPRLTSPAEAMAFHFLGADVINHSIAPEATLSREIGACFVPCAFVTAGFNDYMDRNRGSLLQEGVLPSLSMLTSRIALETAAGLPDEAHCECHDLKSPQPEERHTRF
ncbi:MULTISPECIES: 5'-methylthioadenosine phosphorylase [Agrobacterium]|uniref:5'-methylthioadenosine phosphorylase n=1 Tax=Agrobacterium tumefaciens TaxID=358 RepID=A0AAE6BH17_AGRTU|nr:MULTISPECIES: 5'-methylthioadenosine phosphorylase [Agrobacterium]QCL77198.1 5'-methylthioadenosine phosphorylase [Agrobacterium tumefaciens]QCL82706.1 5'-methylthioadenosine phosphorylase [Agrobacterium tumefaciens]CUX70462.1 5'-methylthioadenosine phosphorylase [Agrobacterium sp. NCPPB 925]